MHHNPRSRLGQIAMAASGTMLLLAGTAFAQPVQVFDDAPSIEQLRSIMIPESTPGLARTIVIQRPDTSAIQAPVQPASTQVLAAAPRAPATPASRPAASIAQPVASMSSEPAAKAPSGALVAEASKAVPAAAAVAFHVNFDFNAARLPGSALPMIDEIAQLMKEAPQLKLRVEGHTDAVGSASYNESLSERRALSVGEYLVKQGIDPSRLILVGKGMTEPLTRNPYDPANRRVQFVRVG